MLKAQKPLKDRYSKAFYRKRLSSIGATIKQKRLKSGISQAALAKQLNIRVENIQNWEHSRTIPDICYLSRIIEFLGYDPLECAKKAD
jgi:transcriptional regulator with XRE-family HTH domain